MPTVRRAVALTAVLAAGLAGLTGCQFDQAQFSVDTTETATVAEIRLSGGGGNVTLLPAEDGKVHIHREVRYRGDRNDSTPYHLEGSTLVVSTDCGWRCGVSYEIRAPRGVKVTGENGSGDVTLTGASDVDITVDSGGIVINRPTGTVRARAHSGDIEVSGAAKDLDLQVDSGNITGRDLRAPHTVAQTSSGDVDLRLTAAGAVQAEADSGSITVQVPGDKSYQVQANADSGTKTVEVPLDPASPYLLRLVTGSGDITVQDVVA
jgi:hypothetical protein